MSADSLRRVNRKGNAGHVVLPQPVNDPSLIESVTGFIQEVVPQVGPTWVALLNLKLIILNRIPCRVWVNSKVAADKPISPCIFLFIGK